MIRKVLVANRGEIARRVFATCRRLGVGTVAVYTDPDANAAHVAEADTRVRLDDVNGYLDIDAVLSAAKTAGADAIHPGYGFLSENPDFAAAVIEAGRTWIGPPVEAIQAMGSKIGSKKMLAAAGVPGARRTRSRYRYAGPTPRAGEGVRRWRWTRHACGA